MAMTSERPVDHRASGARIEYRPDIDGLRAVAVLLVLAFHAFPDVVRGGFIGVDVFFVISGFLITGIILQPLRAGRFSFADFYRRRIRRIFPSLIIVLVASSAAGWVLLSPPALSQFGRHAAASVAFIPNFVFWKEAGYFDTAAGTKPLLHLWSLGVEEQFYLVWPALLVIVAKFRLPMRRVIAAGVVLSFAACVTIVRADAAGAFYLPWTRAWELLAGGLLALRQREPESDAARTRRGGAWSSSIGAVLIVAGALLLSEAHTFPGWWALMPVGGTVLLIAAGSTSPVNLRLSHRWPVAIGLISYPLYLWHWPILALAFIKAHGLPPISVRIGALAASLLLAALTYLTGERYFRRGPRARWQVPALVASMLVVGLAGALTHAHDGFTERFPITIQSVLDYSSYKPGEGARAGACWLPAAAPFSAYAPECYLDPRTAAENGVLLWGDSHAGRLYVGLRQTLGAEANIGQFTRDSCAPVLDYGAAECRASNARVLDEIRAHRPRTVLLFAAWTVDGSWSSGSEFPDRLARTLDALQTAGVERIVLTGPAPRWQQELPKVLYEDWTQQHEPRTVAGRLSSGLDRTVFDVDAQQQKIAAAHHVRYVSLLGLLCDGGGCLTYVPDRPGRLFAWDYGHFTAEGAAFVTDWMRQSGVIR